MKHLLNVCNINGAEVEPFPIAVTKSRFKEVQHGVWVCKGKRDASEVFFLGRDCDRRVEKMTNQELITEARELANAIENCIGGDNCDGCKLKSYMLCEVDRKTADSLIALCDALEETQKTIEQTWEWDMYKAAQKEIERLRKDLAALASESVKRDIALAKLEAEVMAVIDRQGEWIKTTLDSGWVECVCSICGGDAPAEYGRYAWIKSDYCPSCGAKMDKEDTP